MRTARLVGPTPDGTSVVLVTEDGEELSVALDPDDTTLRTALRQAEGGRRPAGTTSPAPDPAPVRRPPRRRETSVDTPLSPRDIQTRIRAGESLEDLVEESGMDADRIERFATPVLAEREHMALTALGASVRRHGEGSGHRPLRAVVAERLLAQGVDADEVGWDAWRRDDASWQVSADYELAGENRHAEFRFDPQGRFSVATDDDARWLAGEGPSPVAASLDRDDELALVRATREPSPEELTDGGAQDESAAAAGAGEDGDGDDAEGDAVDADTEATTDLAAVAQEVADELGAVLQVVPPAELSVEELDTLAEAELSAADDREDVPGHADLADDDPADDPADEGSGSAPAPAPARPAAPRDEAAEPTIAVVRHLTRVSVEVDVVGDPDDPATADEARSALDTLYDMLGGDGYAEESPRVYAGLTDAAAVPEVDEHEFEPAGAVLVPAEPDPETLDQDPDEPSTDEAQNPDEETGEQPDAEQAEPEPEPTLPADDAVEPLIPSPGASRKPGRRKRASVPSWDEIMFGGPKPG